MDTGGQSNEDIDALLRLQDIYAIKSLKSLKESRDYHENAFPESVLCKNTDEGYHHLKAQKNISNLRPAGYKEDVVLKMTRSDDILVRISCPVCESSAFRHIDEFITHLCEDEQLPIFTTHEEAELIRETPDLLALEFGTILDSSQQNTSANLKIQELIESGLDPNSQLHIDYSKDPHNSSFKYLRRRLRSRLDNNEQFDQLVQEVTKM
ncbi:hypothetical protein FOA43_000736 [Brettanomyces nanus]|uniref:Uncharacterized protein n=1 Tax=Eeniella nana TaxID=13502 RepID=A0A875RWV8_EENNA|nr:uncharacterized protein FOA43_000736 [Brettanomyces nanus]QPG73426.1 hypothetical protein FOA43_000736 [Brettanomyces nanus]